MNYKDKDDLKFTLLLLSPLMLRCVAEIITYSLYLFYPVSRELYTVVDLLKTILLQVVIYGLVFSYVYLSFYFSRRRKLWASKLPYLTLLPIVLIIIFFVVDYFKAPQKGEYLGGFVWLILLGGPIYLIVNLAIFVIFKRRAEMAYREGLTLEGNDVK